MTTPITIIGNVTQDPELRFTPSGAAVANLSIAVNSRVFDRQTNEWKDGDTSYYRVNVWREQAENVAESITKGMRVVVTGDLKVRTYDKTDGSGKGISVEITADEVAPSLKYATAKVTKTQRNNNGGNNQQQGGYQNNGGGQPQGGYSQPAGDPWATSGAAATGGNDEPPF